MNHNCPVHAPFLPSLAFALLLLIGSLFLFTRNNDFPYFYHPDEPGKVEQLLSGKWNFHHPLLMLMSARIAVKFNGAEPTNQSAVVLGRTFSALFAAFSLVLFFWLAHKPLAEGSALVVAFLLLFHHQFFELAHYFKEDTALLIGIAFTLVAIQKFWQAPGRGSAALLGFACAVAISGKYTGGVMLLLAIPAILLAPASGWRRVSAVVFFLAVFLIGFAVINFPFLQSLDTFTSSFGRELGMVVHGQEGMTRSIPHAQYWNVFHDNINPVLLVFLVSHVVTFWRTRHHRSLPEWMTLLFPFAYVLALSFSPKSNDRYFLPATAIFTYLAGLGVVDVARWLSDRFGISSKRTLALCTAVAIGSQMPSFYRYWNAFQIDDRADLRAWIETHLPANAVLVIDPRCGLPSPDRTDDLKRQSPLPQKVLRKKYAADFGSLEELRTQGVTHVVVSQSDYGRFFLKSLRPHDAYREKYEANRLFYERLFKEGKLLWKRQRGKVIYLHPGVEVYAL